MAHKEFWNDLVIPKRELAQFYAENVFLFCDRSDL